MRKKVGYAKLGRSMGLTPAKWGEVGGDNEPVILLNRLARRNPDVDWIIVGRNTGESVEEAGLPSNVFSPWGEWLPQAKALISDGMRNDHAYKRVSEEAFDDLDGLIIWLGQHGTSNSSIPMVGDEETLTSPHESFLVYGGYLLHGLNRWKDADPSREEVWLCPDVRNYLKARDVKWPPPTILGQYNFDKMQKHYRYGDPREPPEGVVWADDAHTIWHAHHFYEYARLEVTGMAEDIPFNDEWEGRAEFGMIVNETASNVRHARLPIVRDWALPLDPEFIHGTWTVKSLEKLGRDIRPLPYERQWSELARVRCTLTTPASGSGWATTKPWESFASGTVCFFHPGYDTQGNIVPRDLADPLSMWLHVKDADQFHKRVRHLSTDAGREDWKWLVREQRRRFTNAMTEAECIQKIEATCLA